MNEQIVLTLWLLCSAGELESLKPFCDWQTWGINHRILLSFNKNLYRRLLTYILALYPCSPLSMRAITTPSLGLSHS